MANNLVPAATTLFLLLLTLTTADKDSDLILHVEGNPLEVGSEYYIRRAVGFFGGIVRSGRDGQWRSHHGVSGVTRHPFQKKIDRGDPVKFAPVDETRKEIHLSSEVQIDSGLSAYCRSDGFWRVSFDAYTRGDVIIASGTFGVPCSSFRIEKTEGSHNAYKIAYSPPTTSSLQQRYLTVFRDLLSGLKLVGLTDDSTQGLLFVFYKKTKDVAASY
ncbi:hypothetical protein Cgig2_020588 [Carnegiea gigantea]|uniref:Uncharacterized protein n=1 Tax=Carnegiea gigantea TaxID=171969 RepID=A0A9Q1Q8R1_9CARY|nr:hypothetical protein Cgig2_020588 [Carnegiea gigantea]